MADRSEGYMPDRDERYMADRSEVYMLIVVRGICSIADTREGYSFYADRKEGHMLI